MTCITHKTREGQWWDQIIIICLNHVNKVKLILFGKSFFGGNNQMYSLKTWHVASFLCACGFHPAVPPSKLYHSLIRSIPKNFYTERQTFPHKINRFNLLDFSKKTAQGKTSHQYENFFWTLCFFLGALETDQRFVCETLLLFWFVPLA